MVPRKIRAAILVCVVGAAAAMPAVASAHVVNVSANGETIPLHSGPPTPPAHTGGLLTASEAVDGVRDGQLNVGP